MKGLKRTKWYACFNDTLHTHIIHSVSFGFLPICLVYILYKSRLPSALGLTTDIIGQAMASFVPNIVVFCSMLLIGVIFIIFGSKEKTSYDVEIRNASLDKSATIMQIVAGNTLAMAVMLSIEKGEIIANDLRKLT